MRPHQIFLFTLTALAFGPLACSGDEGTDTKTDGDADTDTDTDTDSDADTDVGGFDVDGLALDWATQAPSAEGLCVDLVDPSPALTGGLPEILLSETIGASGAFAFTDVITDSVLGLLVSVKDCKTSNTTVFTSATGIPFEDMDGLGEGDTLSGVTAIVISMDFLAGMQLSAEGLGYTGDMETDGIFFGLVQDNVGTPLSGATVTCTNCGPTYYFDANSKDGLFNEGAVPNTVTDALAGGTWVVPAGPIDQYTADDGGLHTFPVQLNGSNPGSASITAFFAD